MAILLAFIGCSRNTEIVCGTSDIAASSAERA